MPKMMIPPFEAFEKPEFHIGGDPDLVWETSATWTSFNDTAEAMTPLKKLLQNYMGYRLMSSGGRRGSITVPRSKKLGQSFCLTLVKFTAQSGHS